MTAFDDTLVILSANFISETWGAHKCRVCNCNHIPLSVASACYCWVADGRQCDGTTRQSNAPWRAGWIYYLSSVRDVGLLWVWAFSWFDDQLLHMIYPKTVLKEQPKKSFETVSKAVFGEASFWHFTSSLCLFSCPLGTSVVQFSRWHNHIIITDCLICTVNHGPRLCCGNIEKTLAHWFSKNTSNDKF